MDKFNLIFNKELFIGFFIVLFLGSYSYSVHAWKATRGWQILQNVQLVDQVRKQVQTYQEVKSQFDHLKRESQRLGSNFQSDPSGAIIHLYRVYERDGAIAFNADDNLQQFSQKYPSYSDYALMRGENIRNSQFRKWDKRTQDNFKSVLGALNLSSKQLVDEGQLVRHLQMQNRDATSNTALMQVGNDFASAQIVQAQRMEYLLQNQIQMQASFEAEKQARKAEEQSERDKFKKRHEESLEELRREGEGREFFVPRGTEGAY